MGKPNRQVQVKEVKQQRQLTVWSHLCEVQKQTKEIYDERSQDSISLKYPWKGDINWEEA